MKKTFLSLLFSLVTSISFAAWPILQGSQIKVDTNSDGTSVVLTETNLGLVEGTKTANYVLAGPATGSPAAPTFRQLVNADLSSITLYGLIASANVWTNMNSFTNLVTVSRDYNGSGAPTGNSAPLTTQLVDVDATSTKYTVQSWAVNPDGDADINRINHRISATGTTASVSVDWANAGGTPVVAAASPLSITAATGSIALSGTVPVANGGTSESTYAKGDLLWASAINTLSKLGIGTTGQVLTVGASSTVTWDDPPDATIPPEVAFENEDNVFTAINSFNNSDTGANTIIDMEVIVDTPGTTDPLIQVLRDGDTSNTTNPLVRLSTHSTAGAGTSIWNITARAFGAGLGPFNIRLPEASGTLVSTATSPLEISSSTGAVSFGTKNANTVLAGPTSGSAAAPAFRGLVDDDMTAITVLGRTDTPNTWVGGQQTFYSATENSFPVVSSNLFGLSNGVLLKVLDLETGVEADGNTNQWMFRGIAQTGISNTYDVRLPASSGTFVNNATAPLEITTATGNISITGGATGTVLSGVTSSNPEWRRPSFLSLYTISMGDMSTSSDSYTMPADTVTVSNTQKLIIKSSAYMENGEEVTLRFGGVFLFNHEVTVEGLVSYETIITHRTDADWVMTTRLWESGGATYGYFNFSVSANPESSINIDFRDDLGGSGSLIDASVDLITVGG